MTDHGWGRKRWLSVADTEGWEELLGSQLPANGMLYDLRCCAKNVLPLLEAVAAHSLHNSARSSGSTFSGHFHVRSYQNWDMCTDCTQVNWFIMKVKPWLQQSIYFTLLSISVVSQCFGLETVLCFWTSLQVVTSVSHCASESDNELHVCRPSKRTKVSIIEIVMSRGWVVQTSASAPVGNTSVMISIILSC